MKKDDTSLFLYPPLPSLSPTACFHSQKTSMDRGSIGANNVDAVPSPAGGARHRASSVCSPQLLSLKGSLPCQLGSERGRSQCCNGRNQPVNLCGAQSVSSVRSISNATSKHRAILWSCRKKGCYQSTGGQVARDRKSVV